METDVPNFVGKNYEDLLMERATSLNWDTRWTIRVAARDNAYYALTRDWDNFRINVKIEDGIIVDQTIG
jgi:hypothetical protein